MVVEHIEPTRSNKRKTDARPVNNDVQPGLVTFTIGARNDELSLRKFHPSRYTTARARARASG